MEDIILGGEQILKDYPSKTQKVYEILLNSIIERELSPGQRLVERKLSLKLGVSTTPVREALAVLKREGLVEGSAYGGFFVKRISRKDVIEIYDLREVLEGLAARETAEKINAKQIEELNSLLQSSDECLKGNDLDRYSDYDIRFHALVAHVSGNQRLCEIMQQLCNQTRTLMSTSATVPGRGDKSLAEHQKIVEALRKRDPGLAEKFARDHIIKVKKTVLNLREDRGRKDRD